CGNGAAGAFAPQLLGALGVEVVPLDCDLDYTFPRYNPNPEDLHMLHAMAAATAAESSTTRARRFLPTRSASCSRETCRNCTEARPSWSTSNRPASSPPIRRSPQTAS